MSQQDRKQEIVNLVSLKAGEKAAFSGISNTPEPGFGHMHGRRWRERHFHHHHGIFSFGLMQRLEAMGIRPGIIITKISNHFLRGPVIIEVGRTQLAIGYGMAARILVDKGVMNNEENTAHGQS
ncbi:MAG: ferrous iron transport protein A [Spirochaetales bacterium]|nr:ferrous iron transport protein A [Spirochaetales bacterium]